VPLLQIASWQNRPRCFLTPHSQGYGAYLIRKHP